MENNRDPHDARQLYWRANTALIRNLLIVWALVSLVFSILLVQPLNSIQFGGVPFGFWMAQQGSIYVFVALIFIYAVQMDRLDRKYGRSAISNQSVRGTADVSGPPLPHDSNPPEA
jgi:putative solute:sodium symporter small subunit